MHVLVAPDKFRGTLTAMEAARAIRTGWLRTRPDDVLDLVPMADGGEGTLETLTEALGGELVSERVTGPLGDGVDASYGLAHPHEGSLGVIEMAKASGLALLAPSRRDPLRATTKGTGELMRAALRNGVSRLVVCIGGSATNDAGAGMAQALGAWLLDAEGAPIPPGGAGLLQLARIDLSRLEPALKHATVVVASDVDNPLTGPTGASRVFGPQKGASTEDVVLLDRALGHLAAVVHRDLGIDLRDAPGSGAAGGLGFGLMAFCGASLRPGVEVVMEAVAFPDRLAAADLVITGEGTFDEQSLHGKTPDGVLRAARGAGIRVFVACGRAEVSVPGVEVVSLVEQVGEERALKDARRALEEVAQELAGRFEAATSEGLG